GLADIYGILVKGSQVLDLANFTELAPWTAHLAKNFGTARNMGAPLYLSTVAKNFQDKPTGRNFLEVAKIGGFSAAALTPDAAQAAQFANVAGAVGVVLDAVDLKAEVDLRSACKQASSRPMRAETKKIIDHQLTASAGKILKLVLALFAGIVSAG